MGGLIVNRQDYQIPGIIVLGLRNDISGQRSESENAGLWKWFWVNRVRGVCLLDNIVFYLKVKRNFEINSTVLLKHNCWLIKFLVKLGVSAHVPRVHNRNQAFYKFRMHVVIQNFWTFSKYQKQKFWKNLNLNFFTLPLSEGGTEK